jgi:hypothetical protein
MVISARYDHILRIETLHFLILLQVESTQHTQKVKACDLVCLTRDAIRVLLEKKKKVSLPLLLLLKEKKCLLIISMIMREHYFYDHERERAEYYISSKHSIHWWPATGYMWSHDDYRIKT